MKEYILSSMDVEPKTYNKFMFPHKESDADTMTKLKYWQHLERMRKK